ncbi:MAG: hypothetical protein HJJLKODD_00195 [Phycisphaerae bacterium]|nr:hypothetical protein [Phycisphaerae bacterium]
MTDTSAYYSRRMWLIITAAALYRLLWIGWFGPGPDETSYWDWSRHLAWGYVDHPPQVAYAYWLMRLLFGDTVWGWRLLAVLLAALTSRLMFLAGQTLFDARVGFWAGMLHVMSPLYSMGLGSMIVPEGLLTFWITLALFATARWLKSDQRRWLLLLGLAMGGGLQAKWPALLIPAALFLFILWSPLHRHWLRRPILYALLLISLLFIGPVIYWNATHDWISWTFAVTRTDLRADSGPGGMQLLINSLLAQAAYYSPLIFVGMWVGLLWTLRSGWRGDDRARLLACFSAPVVLTFQLAALFRETLPHWPAAGYLATCIALPAAAAQLPPAWNRFRRRASAALIGLATIQCLVMPLGLIIPVKSLAYRYLEPWLGQLPDAIEPMAHAEGWSLEVRDKILEFAEHIKQEQGQPPLIMTHINVLAGPLAFALRNDPLTVVSRHAEAYQYHLWSSDPQLANYPILFVSSDAFPAPNGRAAQPDDYYHFDSCTAFPTLAIIRQGVTINQVYFWACRDYSGPQ